MTKSTIWWAVTVALVFASGCKTSNAPMTTNDAGMEAEDTGRPTPDAGPPGDGNDTPDEAEPLTDNRVRGVISRPGDLDYYSFTGTAGQWLVVAATATAEDPEDQLDTVVTLFDSSMNKIAENDDEIPRTGTNSGIYTRLPSDGTYYLLVQEFSSWFEEADPVGAPSFEYELIIAALSPATATIDPETGNDAESAIALEYRSDAGLVLGTFTGETDIDVFSFTIPETSGLARFLLLPGGPTGMGSTGYPKRIWIEDEAGTQIAATTLGAEISLQPNLPAGNYRLFVSAPETAGTNDFYIFKAYRFEDNPPEAMEEANNDVATPEPLEWSEDAPGRSGFMLARLALGDIDHFAITTMDDEAITFSCTSRSSGSGVTGLRVDLLNTDGSPLEPPVTAMETPTEGAFLPDVVVETPGTYVLRLTRDAQDPELVGDWVRCGVHLAVPEE